MSELCGFPEIGSLALLYCRSNGNLDTNVPLSLHEWTDASTEPADTNIVMDKLLARTTAATADIDRLGDNHNHNGHDHDASTI